MPTANFVTSKGSFRIELMPAHAPNTVANFVELATGRREWRDPRDGSRKSEPLYDGSVFHRVIDGFMIQGGDPLGSGTGGPGYTFEDECPPGGPRFDQPGLLAMANAGPNTNGSQFFVTVSATPWLNGKHTIFGRVIEGMEVVKRISETDTTSNDRPVDDVVLERVEVEEQTRASSVVRRRALLRCSTLAPRSSRNEASRQGHHEGRHGSAEPRDAGG